jgi:transposase
MRRKQRTFTPEVKFQVVMDYLTGKKRRVEVLREHELNDGTLDRWIKLFQEKGHQVFAGGERGAESAQAQRIAELERLIGRLTVELDAAKKASTWLSSRE